MPITPTYPGVYIEELPSAVRTIMGVGTSITAFVGRAVKGPTDKATLIHSYADYVRIFGGLWKKSSMSYAVYQYFQNGGMDAVIVRATKNAVAETFTPSKTGPTLKAASPGLWGQNLVIKVTAADQDKLAEDPTYFNLAVYQKTDDPNATGPLLEMFRNVSLDPTMPRYIEKLLVDGVSTYLRVVPPVPSATSPLPDDTTYQANNVASDGNDLDATAVTGDPDAKTGMYSLKNADLFNLLCIPNFDEPDSRSKLFADALKFCKDRRAIFLVDPPAGTSSWSNVSAVPNDITSYVDRSENGALFFPRIIAPDPLEEYRLKEFDPCGVVAGVIARTDAQRGVWKAPAGIEATLMGVPDLAVKLTDGENGAFNPKGINCLRTMPDAGRVIWGSRTLRGADSLADQWKYLPVRRMALYIEETLFRGTQWVVFEPNDEKLWSQIRLNVGAFMHSLFVKGAFQGTDPKKAYLVKCDSETTTQTDIDSGIVNILVGFAPLKPAEFVIIQIQQLAGQESK
jgi:phage tail sheath protein FI